ncbi:MAG: hypothetical protein ACLVJO_02690 [[Clostridium] scindens]
MHGAHGYLIGQFLSPYTNLRTDEYGGNFENRMRFLDEIIDGIRKECGEDYPIIVRYSVDEHMDYAGHPECGLHLRLWRLQNIWKQGRRRAGCAGIYETMNVAWEPVVSTGAGRWKGLKQSEGGTDPVIGASVIQNLSMPSRFSKKRSVILSFLPSSGPDWAVKAGEGRKRRSANASPAVLCRL